MKNQTAGRMYLGEFAPKFAELNDDILFGEVWLREAELSARDRSLITVAALIANGSFEQLTAHFNYAKANGLTKTEVAEAITHLAFYVGWPKAWSAFSLAKEAFLDVEATTTLSNSVLFPKGERVDNGLFTGDTYLQILIPPESPHNTSVANVTFSPSARNNWHTHDICQFLLVTGGAGYYQEDGRPARSLHVGDVVNIPKDVKHWHGATPNDWFVHIAITPGETKWLEALDEKEYSKIVGSKDA